MDFVGSGPGLTIPVPNINLSPETLCKNYPLDFLLQPVIPLLSPPTAAEPTLTFSLPLMSEACLSMAKNILSKPSVQTMGAGVLLTGIAYAAWRVSKEWSEALCSTTYPETPKLDEEVERIMAAGVYDQSSATLTCSTIHGTRDIDLCQLASDATILSCQQVSQDRSCSCIDLGAPLKQLQSSVDLVMSRVEDVLSGLKALETRRSLMDFTESDAKKKRERFSEKLPERLDKTPSLTKLLAKAAEIKRPETAPLKEITSGSDRSRVPRVITEKAGLRAPHLVGDCISTAVENGASQQKQLSIALGSCNVKDRSLADIHKLIRDIEDKVDSIKIPHRDRKRGSETSQVSTSTERWDKRVDSLDPVYNFDSLRDEAQGITDLCTAALMTASGTSPPQLTSMLQSLSPQSRQRNSPLKNLKRVVRSRHPTARACSPIMEDPCLAFGAGAGVGEKPADKTKLVGVTLLGNCKESAGDTFNGCSGNDLKLPRPKNGEAQVPYVPSVYKTSLPSFSHEHTSAYLLSGINNHTSAFIPSENSCFKNPVSSEKHHFLSTHDNVWSDTLVAGNTLSVSADPKSLKSESSDKDVTLAPSDDNVGFTLTSMEYASDASVKDVNALPELSHTAEITRSAAEAVKIEPAFETYKKSLQNEMYQKEIRTLDKEYDSLKIPEVPVSQSKISAPLCEHPVSSSTATVYRDVPENMKSSYSTISNNGPAAAVLSMSQAPVVPEQRPCQESPSQSKILIGRRNDFQVKFIANANRSVSDLTSCEQPAPRALTAKEEEWIVVVPANP